MTTAQITRKIKSLIDSAGRESFFAALNKIVKDPDAGLELQPWVKRRLRSAMSGKAGKLIYPE